MMWNRNYLWFIAIALCLGACSGNETLIRPNILFIAIDDLNTCPSAMKGKTSVYTPNFDRLASKGVLFLNAHCAAPACNPSRTAVMTGLAPSTSGVYQNNQDWRESRNLDGHITLPGHFRNNGYKTMGGGKLYHAASLSQKGYTGFMDPEPWDEFFPSKDRQMPQEVLPEKVPMHGNKKFYGGRFDWASLDIDPNEMADAKVVAWAEEQLDREHDRPLFLAVGIYRPHIPWYTPSEHYKRHPLEKIQLPEVLEDDLEDVPGAGQKWAKKDWHSWLVENQQWRPFVRGYYASVSFTDDMIGRLLKALENGPLADNTIIILWSDHGYHLGQKEHWEKFALWEQTTRVPLILAVPGAKRIGRVCTEAVSLLDIYPTLSELCSFEPAEQLDGTSLVPLLKQPGKRTGRSVVTTHGRKNHAVRSDRWRYIRYEDGSEELYDQKKDPRNFHNLAGMKEYESVISKLAGCLPGKDSEKDPAITSPFAGRELLEIR